jgi:LmbE family N-acetylglucosaminyl deacetylase
MPEKTLVIAPHPDDELLGCAGILLRRKRENAEIGWMIVTDMSSDHGWPDERIRERRAEIATITTEVGFGAVFNLGIPTTKVCGVPQSELIERIGAVFRAFLPTEVLVPHRADVHGDHRCVFDAVIACTKWFRFPSICRVLAYETISETEFGLGGFGVFQPNYFVDITEFIEKKVKLISTYRSEIGTPPFPRSVENIRALATFRGATSGFMAAEAFQLLLERH